MNPDTTPIVAIATAPGRGGIGVVRLSGLSLETVMQAVCPLPAGRPLTPRHATYLDFVQADGTVIDQGLAIWFKGPHSYTGEDVLELQGHGGPVVLQMLLQRCLEAGQGIGLRIAQP
ncbi:MAG: tRNA uridine-5-carboxymethylaminomethyl(34) synthesis GTPase MnmE, partial [Proteobacteria bacterium]